MRAADEKWWNQIYHRPTFAEQMKNTGVQSNYVQYGFGVAAMGCLCYNVSGSINRPFVDNVCVLHLIGWQLSRVNLTPIPVR